MKIETERLVLRNARSSDKPAIYQLHMLPETIRYNPSGYPESEAANNMLVDVWCMQHTADHRNSYTLIAVRKTDNAFIGVISLDLRKIKYRDAEVWYKMDPAHWGKGYATEALKGIIEFGFCELKLHRIECGCSVQNTPSYKVMEKAGMKREGTKRKILPLDDGWHDGYLYSILEDEYISADMP